MSEYAVLTTSNEPEHCAIYDFPKGYVDTAGPAEGERVGDDHTDGQAFRMAKEVPGLVVADLIRNALGYVICSGRMKAILAQHATADIEFLRITLLNHKGRTASDDCHIANILGAVDCVDRDRTEGREHPVVQGQMSSITRLFLDESRIPADANLFRIATRPRVVIVRDDLRSVFDREGMSGIGYLTLGSRVRL